MRVRSSGGVAEIRASCIEVESRLCDQARPSSGSLAALASSPRRLRTRLNRERLFEGFKPAPAIGLRTS